MICIPCQTFFQVTQEIRMRWVGHVACVGGEETCLQGFRGDLRERHKFKNLGIDGRIILKVIIRPSDGWEMWTGLT